MKLFKKRSPKSGISSQKSVVSSRLPELRIQKSENKNGLKIEIWVLLITISLSGCVSEPSRTYESTMVNTYAELTLLYEKEKMENKQTDSSYQVIVKEFFKKKGLQQEVFKEQVNELSKNSEVWKLFIQDVSSTMDSLKIINNL